MPYVPSAGKTRVLQDVQRISHSGGYQVPWYGRCAVVSVLHQRQCTSLQFSPSSAEWDEYFPLLSRQTKARALGSHYHQMYFINFSFTFHLFSLRTCHLNRTADRTFAFLSLNSIFLSEKSDAEHLRNFKENSS